MAKRMGRPPKPKDQLQHRANFCFRPKLWQRLTDFAESTGRTKVDILDKALTYYIRRHTQYAPVEPITEPPNPEHLEVVKPLKPSKWSI